LWQWWSPQLTEIGNEKKIAWCEIRWIWRVWQNSDLLFCHLLLDKHRVMCRDVVI
jgi:hypothetical protein